MGNVILSLCKNRAKIALISFSLGSFNAKQREEGLLSVISKYPDIKIAYKKYCGSDTSLAYNITKNILLKDPNIDAIVALNDIASEGAALAVDELELKDKIKVIAFDSNMQEINFLEKGVIDSLIIENPFSIGYLGVKFAVDAMEGQKVPEKYFIQTKVIDKNNMYLMENQRMLFPFVW